MKLRFDKNSIRLRLKKSEVETLKAKRAIQETVLFPDGHFAYDLSVSNDLQEVSAQLQEKSMEIILPANIAVEWMNNDETGIYHTISFGNNHSLNIVIEKDFPCKDREEKENADTFVELAEKIKNNQC